MRQSTLAFVARVPEPELTRPRPHGGWSVKDVLAHLMSCDEETVRRLRSSREGAATASTGSAAWLSRPLQRENGGWSAPAPPSRPARRMARARADLIERLEALPAAALRDPSHEYAVTQWLPTPGWTHERDHVSELRAWWRGQRAVRPGRAAGRRKTVPSKPG